MLHTAGVFLVATALTCAELCEPDPCGGGYCENGGTCSSENCTLETRKCACPSQHEGDLCQFFTHDTTSHSSVDTAYPYSSASTTRTTTNRLRVWCDDVCKLFPDFCQNGGTCVGKCLEGSFFRQATCACPSQYTGNKCQSEILAEDFNRTTELISSTTIKPSCFPLQCRHGATVCNTDGTSAICICEKGWLGDACDIPCHLDCGEHGRCSTSPNDPKQTCFCHACYTGERCETLLSLHAHGCPCTRDCSDHGKCYINENDIMLCDCWGNYTGDNCETFVKPPDEDYWIIVGGCIALLIVLVVLIVVVPYCMYKKRIEIALRVAYFFRKFEDDDDNDYDAFVSYSSNDIDEKFVVRKLYPVLEKENGFKLCLHFRDFQPGVLIVDNIMNCLTRSRRTILVISPRYLESAYCRMEYEIAHEEMLKLRNKVIPIILEDIDIHVDMDKHLKMILNTVTYEQWPGEDKPRREEKFWRKIMLSMPKKRERNANNKMGENNDAFVLLP